MYPVVVVGPPRCGTTMVARVLHEFFGVLMTKREILPPKELEHVRWYEDIRLIEACSLLLENIITLQQWTRRYKRFIRSMQRTRLEWGFKEPRITPILAYALSFFKHPTVIRCHRPKEPTVKSYIKKLGWKPEVAEKHYDTYEQILDHHLRDRTYYRIDFSRIIHEEELIELLSDTMVYRYASA